MPGRTLLRGSPCHGWNYVSVPLVDVLQDSCEAELVCRVSDRRHRLQLSKRLHVPVSDLHLVSLSPQQNSSVTSWLGKVAIRNLSDVHARSRNHSSVLLLYSAHLHGVLDAKSQIMFSAH